MLRGSRAEAECSHDVAGSHHVKRPCTVDLLSPASPTTRRLGTNVYSTSHRTDVTTVFILVMFLRFKIFLTTFSVTKYFITELLLLLHYTRLAASFPGQPR